MIITSKKSNNNNSNDDKYKIVVISCSGARTRDLFILKYCDVQLDKFKVFFSCSN